jgi:integrase
MANRGVNTSRQVKLTKRLIESLLPDTQAFTIWDQEVRRFGVRVMPSGQKSFVLKFTINRQQRWITLGKFGELTLEEGRKLALMRLGEVVKGVDPSIEIRGQKTAPTVRELIDRFLEEHVIPKTRETTAKGYTRFLRNVIQPRLGKLLVKDVSPAEIAKFHHDLRETPRQANQAVAILRKMFNQAEVWKYRPLSSNPCIHIQKNPEEKRERYLSDIELQALGEALVEAEDKGTIPPAALAAIRLLILTGARHNEILKLRWSQVDLQRNCLLFRADEHKTGRKTGAKAIPLNQPALEVLASIPQTLGNPYVIQGLHPGGHFVGLQKVWERIRKRVSAMEAEKAAKKKKHKEDVVNIEDVRIHDLRHTFASVGVSQGFSLPTIGSLLGHSQPSVTQRYAHLDANPRAKASEEIAAKISGELFGKPRKG